MIGRTLSFARELLLQEITFTQWYHRCLPGLFFAATSADPTTRREAIGYVRDVWRELEVAEEFAASAEGISVRSWLPCLSWSRMTWCREMCVSFVEGSRHELPLDTMKELVDSAKGPLHSTPH